MIAMTGGRRPQKFDLDLEVLLQGAGRHPRRVEALHHRQDLFHPSRFDALLGSDLLHRGPQVTVHVQVADAPASLSSSNSAIHNCQVRWDFRVVFSALRLSKGKASCSSYSPMGGGMSRPFKKLSQSHSSTDDLALPLSAGAFWPASKSAAGVGTPAPGRPQVFLQTAIRSLPGPDWTPGPAGFHPPKIAHIGPKNQFL